MALTGTRTYVGFGFGAIQSGLFLFEAYQSGAFKRLVVAEVVPELVSAIRRAGGEFSINIACDDHIRQINLDSIEIYNPAEPVDRQCLIDAIATAEEIGTAIPNVNLYVTPQPESLHRVLAAGLSKKIGIDGPPAVIYTGENNNQAAEILKRQVMEQIPENQHCAVNERVRFLNTVIGKMGQVLKEKAEIHQHRLVPITAVLPRAFLVESFNRILISKIQFEEPFQRGIQKFIEKENLLPFEEAKLFGHNAAHALGGYLGSFMGLKYMADLDSVQGMTLFIKRAFMDESGEALIRRHLGVDPLFTLVGYQVYVDDLLKRMMNPYLLDHIERVTRDPVRKLGWNDRLIGTIRLGLNEGVRPRRFALGAAAALTELNNGKFSKSLLDELWQLDGSESNQKMNVLVVIEEGWKMLETWRRIKYSNLEKLFG